MADVLEGLVLDVVDGEVLELEVERVAADEPGRYGAREFVRLTDGRFADQRAGDDDEAAALMALTYQNRRVRCYVEQRDDEGRIIGELEVLGPATPDPTYLTSDDD